LIRLHLESGTRLERAVPIRREFLGYAPQFTAPGDAWSRQAPE